MDFDSVVQKRRSVRSFKNKKASFKDILEAVDSAIKSPFAGNMNNMKFLIIEDKESIDKISQACSQLWVRQANTLVLVCSDDRNLENLYGERGRVYSRQQAGAAIQTFMLKLVDLGLTSCWIGSYSDELVKDFLEIPQHIQIEAIIPVGYEEKEKNIRKVKKNSLESALYWEKWGFDRKPTRSDKNLEE